MVKHIVTVDGRVFRRTSQRTYSHALVIRYDEEAARKAACEYQPTGTDRRNFAWYSFVAQQTPDVEVVPDGWRHPTAFSAHEIEAAQRTVEGGWDGYVSRRRADEIHRFTLGLRGGQYLRHVASWHMTEAAARKACVRYAHKDRIVEAFVIPVGESV